MLEVKALSVCYEQKCIVDRASLSLGSGQWLMLVGPNGAGKSTLINAIAQGVPYTGQVLLKGRDAKKIKPAAFARSVGVLRQLNNASYGFTVKEVVALGRYAHRKGFLHSDNEGEAAINQAITQAGLMDIQDQSILTLSGGELQRVFLAQVFAQAPSILILDEPVNHLDLVHQQSLLALIADWLKTDGRAVISVVHDLSLAKRYGTHAMLMHHGHTKAQGEIDSVMTRENLQCVYQTDVHAWMREMLSAWD